MSWSLNLIGTPAKIAEAIEAESAKMSGQSKVEFDDAKSHLIGLVGQNFVENGEALPLIKLTASGSGCCKTLSDGQTAQMNRSCSVSIERFYHKLLV